ncbi:hypothetical protein [Candidatus Phytoplasma bonamiae]|uniref:Uncharacterized protein n=1 Tax=Candidatus Phytoplasma bonamiae TaxID=2982626 RepID=A0ABT9D4A0_9MOLU|nr:hypothetical protein ['Bonamia sp.' little leaf phytoplasma]MDO8064253.1 hypothetical protein ['Bonamia sp.' little leaf phytoplasma]
MNNLKKNNKRNYFSNYWCHDRFAPAYFAKKHLDKEIGQSLREIGESCDRIGKKLDEAGKKIIRDLLKCGKT